MKLLDALSTFTEWTDHLLTRSTARAGLLRPLQLDAYRSYGTAARFYIKGRLLADRGLTAQAATDSRWRNFRSMVRRFNSREVAGADLVAELPDGSQHLVTTDDEGYFTLIIEPQALPEPVAYLWYPVPVKVSRLPRQFRPPLPLVQASALVLVPPPTAEFGVISDLDDTVFETSATNVLKMLGRTLFSNAHSRLPYVGVADFYRRLQRGRTNRPDNPFFYVSSSPWNLYDMLDEFMGIHEMPPGPLLLRDLGISRPKNSPPPGVVGSAAVHFAHKLHEINDVLGAYPNLSFVLLGDSGQEDARIYREVVRQHPGRILAIYIRDVQVPARALLVGPITKELHTEGVPMLLVPDYATAAAHAASLGLIVNEPIPEQPVETIIEKASE
ncbi:App1 family protein [Hymenobacter arizonensis]|uniref:Phosphatidate phosphatase APP1 n=1 Tax=Hymenobacter arizonensis TaxID=1227077 RepID=A0A1I5TVC4_HYMAR|nr:phosphatase domain-containing protein [Hymenobacter arizonensis]SFP87015.1 Phosphatidate phosphatase APP1 [Hymenobacter arizonensis]